ncbi:MAG: GTP-binding protein [Candidatus Lokiarchaeota archaeon]|nr:GTP-binding protein [Candidatus Lokiarchaeota archaeon]
MFNLIRYINFLTQAGKSVLFRNYGSSDIDKGLTKEILNIFKVASQNESEITINITDEFKYFSATIGEYIIIVCTDLEDENAIIKSKIHALKTKFNKIISKNYELIHEFEQNLDDIILPPIKVAIVGLGGTGKEELIQLICGEQVNLEYQPTINVDLSNFDGTEIGVNRTIMLWDFPGQSNYRALWASLLDRTDIVLLVLDSSYESLNPTKDILRDILEKNFKDKLIIGIANKQDLPHRLTPKFCERMLSEVRKGPPIPVYGMVSSDPAYREKIHAILRDAIRKLYP